MDRLSKIHIGEIVFIAIMLVGMIFAIVYMPWPRTAKTAAPEMPSVER